MSNYAIIVAGGSGQRMQSNLPKQYLSLEGIPVLMRSIHAFHASETKPEIIVVLAADMQDHWLDLCYKFQFHVPHLITTGGQTRFQSVKKGLEFLTQHDTESLNPQSIIAIHDGARPLVTSDLIDRSFELARQSGSAIAAVQSTDSIRLVDQQNPNSNRAYPRNLVYKIQTPQTFKASILLEAYDQAESSDFTDDASVVASKDYPITLLEGDHRNLKITTDGDLEIASLYLQKA